MRARSLSLSLCLFLIAAPPAMACGPDSDCAVGDRTYRLYVPETGGAKGAFFFAHGYRGSADGAMRNAALRRLADRMGLVFVALDSAGDDWNLAHRPEEPGQREAREYDYVAAVIEDVAGRVDLDRTRLIATGFSAGGMMTWTLACGMSGSFAGFVPMSGTFWAPVPETCPTPPASVIHIHGTADPVVPLAGRPIGGTRQGDVLRAMAMYAAKGAFLPAGQTEAPGGMECTLSRDAAGRRLDLCLFEGGHDFSVGRLEWGLGQVLGQS